MNYSTYRISLDVHDIASQISISVKQGETKRKIVASLTENGRPYQITADCNAVFSAKAGDNILYNACRIEGNSIVYEFTQQTTASVGYVNCEFELRGGDGELITSPRFTIIVEETINTDEEVVEAAHELTEIERLLSEMVKVESIVDNLTTAEASKPLSAAQGVVLKKLVDSKVGKPTYEDSIDCEGSQYISYALKSDDATMHIKTMGRIPSVSIDGEVFFVDNVSELTLPEALVGHESEKGFLFENLWCRGAKVEINSSDDYFESATVSGTYSLFLGTNWEKAAEYDLSGQVVTSGDTLFNTTFDHDVVAILIRVVQTEKASGRGNFTITLTDKAGRTASNDTCGLFYNTANAERICRIERDGFWWAIWPGTTSHSHVSLGKAGAARSISAVATTSPTLGAGTILEVWTCTEVRV